LEKKDMNQEFGASDLWWQRHLEEEYEDNWHFKNGWTDGMVHLRLRHPKGNRHSAYGWLDNPSYISTIEGKLHLTPADRAQTRRKCIIEGGLSRDETEMSSRIIIPRTGDVRVIISVEQFKYMDDRCSDGPGPAFIQIYGSFANPFSWNGGDLVAQVDTLYLLNLEYETIFNRPNRVSRGRQAKFSSAA
jgi:hypothetical protein